MHGSVDLVEDGKEAATVLFVCSAHMHACSSYLQLLHRSA